MPPLSILPCSAQTRKEFLGAPRERNEEEETQLKAFEARGPQTQEEEEVWDQLLANQEERKDRRTETLRRELERKTESIGLQPLPEPLPKSSLWHDIQPPERYKFEDIREFYVACEKGDLKLVSHWVREKIGTLRQIGIRDGLACAARGNQVEVCRHLLATGGARVHGQVVREACKNRSPALFQLSLEYEYHPNQQVPSKCGEFGTALRHCIDSEHVTRVLLEHGADPNLTAFRDRRTQLWSQRSAPPMKRKTSEALANAISLGNVAVMELLLKHGTSTQAGFHLISVMESRLAKNREIADEWRPAMNLLLLLGADIDAACCTGGTVLSVAVLRNRWDVVQYLLVKGADPRVAHPVRGEDSFMKAADVAGIDWEASGDTQKYVSYLYETINGAKVEEIQPPGVALENPLVRFMTEMAQQRGKEPRILRAADAPNMNPGMKRKARAGHGRENSPRDWVRADD